jgi:tetratricopeptide (TPR) repeat protein
MAAADAETVAEAYINMAYAGIQEGRAGEALELLSVALGAAESIGTPPSLMLVWGNIGLAKLLDGDTDGAREAFSRQLRMCVDKAFVWEADEGLAAVAAADGEFERAARLRGAARALGYPVDGDQRVDHRLERDYYARAHAWCGNDAWTLAEREGATPSSGQAIRYDSRAFRRRRTG